MSENNEQRCRFIEDSLRQTFLQTLPEQVDRHRRAQMHNLIADEFFSAAATECRDMFVAGHFYGCITLCQSVAEGLAKFIAEKSRMHPPGEFEDNVDSLRRRHLISDEVATALLAIHGLDRNNFHHLNKGVEQHYRKLEARAEECLRHLFVVESTIFAYEIKDGYVQPKHRKFWNIGPDGTIPGYVRQ
jgi:hypothetical protein